MGKRVWIKRELPGTKLILRSADKKQEFASPTSILIDDREDTIKRVNNAGGIGIHHPENTGDISQVIQALKDLGYGRELT